MKVFNDYDGASIDIISYDKEKNIAYLSLRKEKGKYSNYYNFTVENKKNISGKIILMNIDKKIFNLNDKIIPLIKKGKKYQKIDINNLKYYDDKLEINIDANSIIEISSYPKYTLDDLHNYLLKTKDLAPFYSEKQIPKITIDNNSLKYIVIIARQHPGETLSSYFLEGVIDYLLKHRFTINYNFIIYPIVNLEGVKNGCHRYYNEKDYNRTWFKSGIINEEDIIKNELKNYNLELFIDIHCDELSNFDYLRLYPHYNIKSEDFTILKDYSKLYRLLRGLVKDKKIINIMNTSARDYFYKKFKCDTLLIELSLIINNQNKVYMKGYNFFESILNKIFKE